MELTIDLVRYLLKEKKVLKDEKAFINDYEEMKKKLLGGKKVYFEGEMVDLLELFNKQPASSNKHGAVEAGLNTHSISVSEGIIIRLVNAYKKQIDLNIESAFKIGILHDLCKTVQYHWNKKEKKYEYDKELIKHHATLSINMCWMLGIELKTNEMACIRHHMNSWEENEDYLYETVAEAKWRAKHPETVTAVCWADMRDNNC